MLLVVIAWMGFRRRAPWVLLVAMMGLLVGPSARAAAPTAMAIEHFEPLPAQDTNVLSLGTSSLLPHLRPSVGLTFHYQHNPLVLVDSANDDLFIDRVVGGRFNGELWAALGLFDYGEIGFVLPVSLFQFGDPLSVFQTEDEVTGTSMSDVRIKAEDVERLKAENLWFLLEGRVAIATDGP